MPAGEDRVKYDHLFSAGDFENKSFWAEAIPTAGAFENRFVEVADRASRGEAEECFNQALEVARSQSAKPLELR
jgi:hypothetical protein